MEIGHETSEKKLTKFVFSIVHPLPPITHRSSGTTILHAQPQAKMMGVGINSDESPEMVPIFDPEDPEDEITPIALSTLAQNGYGAADQPEDKDVAEKKDKEKKGKKKEKSPQKQVADLLKTDMAAERTFFKWLWTGLHTGAIGSFIFVAFDTNKKDPLRLWVVGFAWLVAFCLVLYGTFAYYRRREALRTGDIGRIPNFTREHSPLVVVVSLAVVVGVSLAYALWGQQKINITADPNDVPLGLDDI